MNISILGAVGSVGLALLLSNGAVASDFRTGNGHNTQNGLNYDYATVIDAQPIFKTIRVQTPKKECWQEEVAYNNYDRGHDSRYDRGDYRHDGQRRNSGVSTVVGGVIGGAIGNAVGHSKKNKKVGTIVGVILGSTLGNAYGSRKQYKQDHHGAANSVSYGVEERCETVQVTQIEEKIVGYNVRYRYNNATYSTRMHTDPGDTIRVQVSVLPVS